MAYEVVRRRPARNATRIEVVWDRAPIRAQGATILLWVGPQQYRRYVSPNGFMTINEAAQAIPIYALALYRLVWSKRVPSKKVGGVLMIPLTAIKKIRLTMGSLT